MEKSNSENQSTKSKTQIFIQSDENKCSNIFNIYDLLEEFNKDQDKTIKMVQESMKKYQQSNIPQKIMIYKAPQKQNEHKCNIPKLNALKTNHPQINYAEKLFDQTNQNLQESIEEQKKYMQLKKNQKDLELAQQNKILANLKVQLLEAKSKTFEMETLRDEISQEYKNQLVYFKQLELKTKEKESEIQVKRQILYDLKQKRDNLLIIKQQKIEQNQNTQNDIQDYQNRIQKMEWRKQYFFPQFERELLDKYLEYKGNIRVFVRSRPILPIDFKAYGGTRESFENLEEKTKILNDSQIELTLEQKSEKHLFTFDNVFGNKKNQIDIYEEVEPLIQSFIDGNDVCIFSYGQTGSGKTFTMGTDAKSFSSEESQGIIPRSLKQILQQVNAIDNEINVSFQEIYLGTVKDLMDPKNVLNQINQASKYSATQKKVSDLQQVFNLLKKAEEKRTTAKTACNENSSRGHSILQIKIRQNLQIDSNQQLQCLNQKRERTLTLVDLAGSERLDKTQVEGERLKESQAINSSLSTLSKVICAMKKKDDIVPYRESMLTFILYDCLSSPSSKILMIVNLNPISLNESLCSLKFAQQVFNL